MAVWIGEIFPGKYFKWAAEICLIEYFAGSSE